MACASASTWAVTFAARPQLGCRGRLPNKASYAAGRRALITADSFPRPGQRTPSDTHPGAALIPVNGFSARMLDGEEPPAGHQPTSSSRSAESFFGLVLVIRLCWRTQNTRAVDHLRGTPLRIRKKAESRMCCIRRAQRLSRFDNHADEAFAMPELNPTDCLGIQSIGRHQGTVRAGRVDQIDGAHVYSQAFLDPMHDNIERAVQTCRTVKLVRDSAQGIEHWGVSLCPEFSD
jgi:hypothetical protein